MSTLAAFFGAAVLALGDIAAAIYVRCHLRDDR